MSQPADEAQKVKTASEDTTPQTFADVLRPVIGRVVTFVNPESLEDAPMGYQITTGFYRAKVLGVQADFITVATELLHKGRDATKEPVRQYIRLSSIKRITIAKTDILVHI